MQGIRGRRMGRGHAPVICISIHLLLLLAPFAPPSAEPARGGALARGDAAWRARAERLDGEGRLADPAAIESAIQHYAKAVADDPDSLEARWKLLRTFHYSIDFASRSEEARMDSAERAIEVAKTSIDRLDATEGTPFDRARVYFWSSIAWGARASRVVPRRCQLRPRRLESSRRGRSRWRDRRHTWRVAVRSGRGAGRGGGPLKERVARRRHATPLLGRPELQRRRRELAGQPLRLRRLGSEGALRLPLRRER